MLFNDEYNYNYNFNVFFSISFEYPQCNFAVRFVCVRVCVWICLLERILNVKEVNIAWEFYAADCNEMQKDTAGGHGAVPSVYEGGYVYGKDSFVVLCYKRIFFWSCYLNWAIKIH